MARIGRRSRLKPGTIEDYKRWHRTVWPELLGLISEAGIRNYTIYLDGDELFSYLEVDDWNVAMERLGKEPVSQRFQELMRPYMDAEDATAPWTVMEEVFHLD